MKQSEQRGRLDSTRRALRTAVAVGLALVSVPVLASGRCVTVEVPAPFVRPDGRVHAPGSLKLCDSLRMSPVSTLHKVYLAGYPVGLLEGKVGRSEGRAEREPYVLFRRNADAQLVLIGYGWPDGRTMETYSLARSEPAAGQPGGTSSETIPVERGAMSDSKALPVAAADQTPSSPRFASGPPDLGPGCTPKRSRIL